MTAPPVRLTAGAPALVLVDALARAGWGMLADHWRGVRITLRTLAGMADRAGVVRATVTQVADRSGYATGSDARHSRRCLLLLVDAGLVEWTPGGLVAGRPVPGVFVIVRRRLVALLAPARAAFDDVLAARAAVRDARIRSRDLRHTVGRKTRNRAPKRLVNPTGHGVRPSLPTEETAPAVHRSAAPPSTVAATVAGIRALIRPTRRGATP